MQRNSQKFVTAFIFHVDLKANYREGHLLCAEAAVQMHLHDVTFLSLCIRRKLMFLKGDFKMRFYEVILQYKDAILQ